MNVDAVSIESVASWIDPKGVSTVRGIVVLSVAGEPVVKFQVDAALDASLSLQDVEHSLLAAAHAHIASLASVDLSMLQATYERTRDERLKPHPMDGWPPSD